MTEDKGLHIMQMTEMQMAETEYYDVLKQFRTYYKSEGAFLYKFSDGGHQVEKIYRTLGDEIQNIDIMVPIAVNHEQVKLLQEVSTLTLEESCNAAQIYGEIYWSSLKQFHIDYEIQQFSCVAVNNSRGELVAFMGVTNPHVNHESKELMELLSRFVCRAIMHKQDQKVQVEVVDLEEAQLNHSKRLANKAMVQNKISALLEEKQVGTMFVINIDNFRQLNTVLGYHVGDQVLVDLLESLQQMFHHTDVMGRIGGDEFMVFSPEFISRDFIEKIANQILKKCHHYYNKDGVAIEISVSIGICQVEDRCKTFQPLYENADYALYLAKKLGKNRYHVYSNTEYRDDIAVADELRFYSNVIEKLKKAIENQSFVVHYQPLYHVLTGEFTQAEALVRMEQPDGTLIYPNDFMQVAETSGLVVEMTYQILEHVCRDMRKIITEQPDTVLSAIAINVPYLQFVDPNMESRFMEILEKYQILPSQIKLEITERILIEDMELMTSKMAALIEKGFEFELDDFGTNYSNLHMCLSLPLDVIKLDRSLLLAAFESDRSRRFFEHTIAGIHDIDRQIVLEGVETQEQLEWAVKCKCKYIQGFYFSKAVDYEAFSKMLSSI